MYHLPPRLASCESLWSKLTEDVVMEDSWFLKLVMDVSRDSRRCGAFALFRERGGQSWWNMKILKCLRTRIVMELECLCAFSNYKISNFFQISDGCNIY